METLLLLLITFKIMTFNVIVLNLQDIIVCFVLHMCSYLYQETTLQHDDALSVAGAYCKTPNMAAE